MVAPTGCPLAAVSRWLKAGEAQIFRLFGYAGTGKTTLARHVAEHADGGVAFAAFTGKAAHVMRGKGCKDATTIHSLIYRARGEDENGPTFVLNDDSSAGKSALIVIDECSMVDAEIGRDLLSFDKPVLVLGAVEGEVVSQSVVTVGETGRVKATVAANELVVAGELVGDCVATARIELKASGRLHGSIRSPRLSVSEGAVLQGRSETTSTS